MKFSGKTDVGMQRQINQDNFLIREYAPRILLTVVCDGMGGARGGWEASSTAAETFVASMDAFVENYITSQENLECTDSQIHRALRKAALNANKAVYDRSEADENLKGMGTTLVAALIMGSTLYTVNIGDSRLYVIQGTKIQQITHDHSYVQYLVDTGYLSPEEARTAQNRNIITRAVGTESSVDADVFVTEMDPAVAPTYVLLCSDGLTNHIEESQLSEIISADTPLEEKTETLVGRANALGGTDNITAVVVSL